MNTPHPTLWDDIRTELRTLGCALLGHKPTAILTHTPTREITVDHWTCRRCHTELTHYRNDTHL